MAEHKYKIFSHFLNDYLDPDHNWADDLLDEEGNHIGWRVISRDLGGGGETQFIVTGEYPLDSEYVEEEELCKVKTAPDGHLHCDIYLGDRGAEGALIGLPTGMVSGGYIGESKHKAGLGLALGSALAGIAGWLIGKAQKVWRVAYLD